MLQAVARYVFSTLLLLIFISCAASQNDVNSFAITAGIMQRVGDQAIVIQESTDVPFVTYLESPDYGFGYRIDADNDYQYRHRVVLKVHAVTDLTGDQPESIGLYDDVKVVRYPEEVVSGHTHLFMRLGEEDRPGIYEIHIYINGEQFKVLKFNVVPVPKKLIVN